MPTLEDLLYGDLKWRLLIDDPRASLPRRVEIMCITAHEELAGFSLEELRYARMRSAELEEAPVMWNDLADSEEPTVRLRRPCLEEVKAASEEGAVWAWGHGSYGQLGVRPVSFQAPTFVPLLGRQIVSVACGTFHTLALDSAGKVLAFGKGYDGQLGLGDNKDSNAPAEVAQFSETRCCMISCGAMHSVALTTEGAVFTWGRGDAGQLGHGNVVKTANRPIAVAGCFERDIAFIASGGNSTMALTADGFAIVWGSNDSWQLGIPTSSQTVWWPMVLRLPAPFCFVAMGVSHAAAITPKGALYTWGKNAFGCVGYESSEAACPVRLVGMFLDNQQKLHAAPPCYFVSCGTSHTAVITRSGKIFTFGDAAHGRTGHSEPTAVPKRLEVFNGTGEYVRFRHVSCGAAHTVATSFEGTVWTWGSQARSAVPSAEFTSPLGAVPPIEQPSASEMSSVEARMRLLASAVHMRPALAEKDSGDDRAARVATSSLGPRAVLWMSGATMVVTGATSAHNLIVIGRIAVPSQFAKDGAVSALEELLAAGELDLTLYSSFPPPRDFTPLHAAVESNNLAAVGFFVRQYLSAKRWNDEARAKALCLDVVDAFKVSALHVCAVRGLARCTRMLLDAGANPDLQNLEGNTPLHIAAAGGYTATVSALLERQADRTIVNELGQTALHMAVANESFDAATALAQCAAAVDALDKDGRTPLDLSKKKNAMKALLATGKQRDVFISYAHADIDFAKKVKFQLEKNSLRCWIDLNILAAGSDWRSDIGAGIMQAKLLIFLISKTSAVSDWCIKELYLAKSRSLIIIPVFFEEVELMTEVEALVHGVAPVDFIDPARFYESIDRLVVVIRKFLKSQDAGAAAPAMRMIKEVSMDRLVAAKHRFLFISHAHDPCHPSHAVLADVKQLRANLLMCGIQSCANLAVTGELDGPYNEKVWRSGRKEFLKKSIAAIVLISAESLLESRKQRDEIAEILQQHPDRVAVAFSGSNVLLEDTAPAAPEKAAAVRDIIDLVGNTPLFRLDTAEGMRQLIFVVHLWERESDQAERVVTLSDELQRERKLLDEVDSRIAVMNKFFAFTA